MKKFIFVMPFMAVSLLASCNKGGGDDPGPTPDPTPTKYEVALVNSDTSKGSVTGGGTFVYTSTTIISATPNNGYKFAGWYLDGKKVSDSVSYHITVPDHNVEYTATWSNLIKPTLTIIDYNDKWGSTTGSGDYLYNQDVTITANPKSGYSFSGWYSNGIRLSIDLSYTFKMPDEAYTISAIFDKTGQILTFSKLQNNTLSVSSGSSADLHIVIPAYTLYENDIYQITEIGMVAFRYGYLTSINIPSNIVSIGVRVFDGCSLLSSIVIEPENLKYDSRNNCNAIIETETNTLIYGCKDTIIPTTVTSIAGGAFNECPNLVSIEIPDGVISIGNGAFIICSSLMSVSISNSVISIGRDVFRECTSLETLDLTKCDHVVEAGLYFLNDTKDTLQIKVKSNLLNDYKNATNWANYADKIIGVD